MDINAYLKSLTLALCLTLGVGTYCYAETPPYVPNKIDFNEENAVGLVEDLRTYALTIAQKYVQRYGGFAPFGVTITLQGEYQVIVGNGKDAKKDLAMLFNAYRKKAQSNEIVAAAVVYDTRMNVPNENRVSDAIYITVDSKLTRSNNGFAFYTKVRPGHYRFDNLRSHSIDQTKIFRRASR